MKYTTKKSLALLLVLSLLAFQVGCDRVKTAIKYVNRSIPLLQIAGVDTSEASQFISLMTQFDKDPSAATLSAATLVFDKLVTKAQAIPEQGKRTAVLVILVAANIAVQELAEKYLEKTLADPDNPKLGAPQVRMTLRKVAQRKKWNCRASGDVEKYKAGQYMPMEMCKKYPDLSVVETQ